MLATFIKLELHSRWQGWRLHTFIGLLLSYVIISYLLLMRYRVPLLPIGDGITDRRMLTMITLIDTVLALGLSPLLTLNTLVPGHRRDALLPAMLGPVRSVVIVLGQLFLPIMLITAAVIVSTLPTLLLAGMSEQVSIVTVLATRCLLLVFGLGGMLMGLCGSALLPDVYTAAGIVYLIVGCVGGSVILAGPLIAHLTNAGALIHLVVWINPFIGMASALEVDLLRTEWLYILTPLGQRPVVYPTWYGVGLGYLIVSVLLIAATTWRIASLRRNMDCWPLSNWRW